MYKASFYFLLMIVTPIYSAYFFTIIWSMTAHQFFDVNEITIQQAYCVTCISTFLNAKFKNEKSDIASVALFSLIFPPVACFIAFLVTLVIR